MPPAHESQHSSSPILLNVGDSAVEGRITVAGPCEFLGIPFARAERFRPPVDVSEWGRLDATRHGPMCPQTPGTLESMLGANLTDVSEDCLRLNVFTPSTPTPGANLPVLFWIHGGAFVNGAGSIPWYHGGNLARRGCVVVTINYRLGALGYLGDGNFGTLDQLSALRWVARHIDAFGGDPRKVTIFGESAGGAAVVSLLAAPDASDLVHRAWAMSPSIGQFRTLERATEVTAQFLAEAGLSSLDEALTMPVEDLLSAQSRVLSIPSDGYDIFSPVAGGAALPADILGAAASSPIPLVIGTTRDENKLFSMLDPTAATRTAEDWHRFLDARFGASSEDARRVYEDLRPGEAPAGLISAVNTDIGFRQRARRLAEARCAQGSPTWMYWFTWPTPVFGGVLGSCHALDIPFAFDNIGVPGAELFTGDGAERQAIADSFSSAIATLANHGHPGWSQFDLVTRDTLIIDAETALASDPEPSIRALFG